MIRESFAARNLFIFTFLIAVTCLSFTVLFFYHQSSSSKRALEEEGRLLVKLLAYNSRLGVFAENNELLRDPTAGIFQDGNVQEVSIYTRDGTLLIRETREGNNPPEEIEGAPFPGQSQEMKRIIESGDPLQFESSDRLRFWAPVVSASQIPAPDNTLRMEVSPNADKGRLIGFVRLDLTKQQWRLNLRFLLYRSCVIGLLFMLAGFLIAYLINRRLTEPLKRLTENVISFGRGGSVEQMPVEREDEIGVLAQAFNTMTESLSAREREKEALEERLRQAQKMEAIGTLTGGIAHDFNNLLAVIKGYGEIILSDVAKGENPTHFAERLVATANKAITLTRSLLTFSRKQIIDPKPIRLHECIRNMGGPLLRLLNNRIELKIDLAPGELRILADPGQIDQVLLNLVTNARDAMPEGGVISITTRAIIPEELNPKLRLARKSGAHVLLAVGDTGVGMDSRVQERIFDPFFTTKAVGTGTGLGLSIVYGIMKQNDWFIEVDSQPGCGSTFRIYIPLLESDGAEVSEERRSAPAPGVETILLAEDDDDVRAVSRIVLESNGYRVIEAVDGVDALEKFQQHGAKVNLLLFDLMMPRKNGRNAYEEIRKKAPGIKVIFFSGYPAGIIEREELLVDTNLHFISKPVSENDLTNKIREVLGS